jgi:hypothetical protein
MTKFKSVTVRDKTFEDLNKLSSELLPKVQLSKSQTIDRITEIAKNTLSETKSRYATEKEKS